MTTLNDLQTISSETRIFSTVKSGFKTSNDAFASVVLLLFALTSILFANLPSPVVLNVIKNPMFFWQLTHQFKLYLFRVILFGKP